VIDSAQTLALAVNVRIEKADFPKTQKFFITRHLIAVLENLSLVHSIRL